MPSVTPLRAGDPKRIGRYRLDGRLSPNPRSAPTFVACPTDGPRVMLELLDRGRIADPAASDRFADEARAAARVPPCCVTPICDFGVEAGLPYVVTACPAGHTLREDVAEHGPVPGDAMIALALGTAAGLTAIHRAGLVHGAFGPDHVLLTTDGPQVTGYSVTPPYGAATPAADIQAWARTMLFAAAGAGESQPAPAGRTAAGFGRRPARTGRSALSALPAGLRRLVAESLHADPGGRPDARAILAELLGEDGASRDLLAAAARSARQSGLGREHRGTDRAARAGWRIRVRPRNALAGRPPGHGTEHADGWSGPGLSRGSGRRLGAGRPDPGRGHQGARRGGPTAPGRRARHVSHPGVITIFSAVLAILAAVAVLGSFVAKGSQDRPGRPRAPGSLPLPTGPAGGQRTGGAAASNPAAGLPALRPAALDGTWTGTVRQASPIASFSVRLVMRGSGGSVYYRGKDFSCAGTVRVLKPAARALRLSQVIVRGRNTCLDGAVLLTPGRGETAQFLFHGRGRLLARGWLSRRSG